MTIRIFILVTDAITFAESRMDKLVKVIYIKYQNVKELEVYAEIAYFNLTVTPVSYTHLDVYKRQNRIRQAEINIK